jgi:hypothetical protein
MVKIIRQFIDRELQQRSIQLIIISTMLCPISFINKMFIMYMSPCGREENVQKNKMGEHKKIPSKPGMVVLTCYPSYAGGVGRRIAV